MNNRIFFPTKKVSTCLRTQKIKLFFKLLKRNLIVFPKTFTLQKYFFLLKLSSHFYFSLTLSCLIFYLHFLLFSYRVVVRWAVLDITGYFYYCAIFTCIFSVPQVLLRPMRFWRRHSLRPHFKVSSGTSGFSCIFKWKHLRSYLSEFPECSMFIGKYNLSN